MKENEPRTGTSKKEVQSNTTDNESAKMISSHGMIQGYNANAIVDEKHQIIVYPEAFGEGQDGEHVSPMLKGANKNLEEIGWEEPLKNKIVTADSSYSSVNSVKACEEYETDAYIPDKNFRRRDVRFSNKEKYRRATDRKKKNLLCQ